MKASPQILPTSKSGAELDKVMSDEVAGATAPASKGMRCVCGRVLTHASTWVALALVVHMVEFEHGHQAKYTHNGVELGFM
jgi:hypothetical protein